MHLISSKKRKINLLSFFNISIVHFLSFLILPILLSHPIYFPSSSYLFSLSISFFLSGFPLNSSFILIDFFTIFFIENILTGHTEHFTFENTETDVTKIALSFYSGLFAYNGWYVFIFRFQELFFPLKSNLFLNSILSSRSD